MSMDSSALSTFEVAAGVSASEISLTIRTILLVILFFWAGAFIYSEIHHFRHHGVDIFDALRKTLRMMFVVSVAVVLVFII